jgi:hypothetical protein
LNYQNSDIMATFTPSESYGNDLTIKVLSRTAKTATIETTAWGIKRVKIREYQKGVEAIYFKTWIVIAAELFNADEAAQISMEKACY